MILAIFKPSTVLTNLHSTFKNKSQIHNLLILPTPDDRPSTVQPQQSAYKQPQHTMKYPVDYIAELFSLQKPELHPQLQAVAKINGLPPERVGMNRRGFFALQNNGIILGTDTKPRYIRFRDSNEGHERAWDYLAELAAERGEKFEFRQRVYIESTRGKYHFWRFKARRKVKQVQEILQDTIGNVDHVSPTPRQSGSFENAPIQVVSDERTQVRYHVPECGEPGSSKWAEKQREPQKREGAQKRERVQKQKQKQDEDRQDSGMTAAEEQLLKAVETSTLDKPESVSPTSSNGEQEATSSSAPSSSGETSNDQEIKINKEFAAHSNICAMRFQLGSFLEDHGPEPKNVGAFSSEIRRAFRRAYALSSLHRVCEGCENEGWSCEAFGVEMPKAGQPKIWRCQGEAKFWYDFDGARQPSSAGLSGESPYPPQTQRGTPDGQSYEGKGKARMV